MSRKPIIMSYATAKGDENEGTMSRQRQTKSRGLKARSETEPVRMCLCETILDFQIYISRLSLRCSY